MTICGIKFTHDGAVAIVEDGKLVFSYEMEKLENNKRYSPLDDFSRVVEILNRNGYEISDVDQFVLDGWGEQIVSVMNAGLQLKLPVANYGFAVNKEDLLAPVQYENEVLNFRYKSYMHVASHVFGAYCTSPFPSNQQGSYILIWDGSMSPQLFYYDFPLSKLHNLGPLFFLNGSAYALFGLEFPPFKDSGMDDVHAAGKIMAYIALGKCSPKLLKSFHEIFNQRRDRKGVFTEDFVGMASQYAIQEGYSGEDAMATFHTFLIDLILKNLRNVMKTNSFKDANLCLGGGCALNIKWNSELRKSDLFRNLWVPPFPNDSGNAIGVACCEMLATEGIKSLQWNMYSGPTIMTDANNPNWSQIRCDTRLLAELIHDSNEPIVLLHGKAELGPRALGNRSIIASATSPEMKTTLNRIKKREYYRPVAPICIEEDAPIVFDPGTFDPFMLFDHVIRPEWIDRIPAVRHLDNSARLQTVNQADNATIYSLLTAYKKLSGIPVLCNTSANLNGCGFFPDVSSAMRWGMVDFIWINNVLHFNKSRTDYIDSLTNRSEFGQINKSRGIEV